MGRVLRPRSAVSPGQSRALGGVPCEGCCPPRCVWASAVAWGWRPLGGQVLARWGHSGPDSASGPRGEARAPGQSGRGRPGLTFPARPPRGHSPLPFTANGRLTFNEP